MALQNREVLIIDDDPMIRKLVRKVLEGSGLSVSEAESVDEAFKIAEVRGPHVVVTDLMMPEKDGFVFLEKRKESNSLKKVPVIVLSAIGEKQSVFRAMSLGALDYLVKPFNAKILLQKLRKIMKDREFGTHNFAAGDRPDVEVSAPARVMNTSEIGFLLEAPVKLASDSKIGVTSKVLQRLRMNECHLRTKKSTGSPGGPGLFLTTVDVVGIPMEIAKHIRQILRGK